MENLGSMNPKDVRNLIRKKVTPQAVAMRVKPDLMITHAPGYMFICDTRDEDLSVF